MKVPRTLVSALLASVFLVGTLAGCGSSGGPPPQEIEKQTKAMADIKDLAIRTQGDWNKLSQAERDQLISLSSGDVGAAQRDFTMQWTDYQDSQRK